MAIRLFNSLSRETEALEARSDNGRRLGFYCCGPTVYGPAHIGNFRTFVLQDVLRRVLEADGAARGYQVVHVRNLTDVDDKTIRGARESAAPLPAFTRRWTDRFHADCRDLNLLPPHHEPAATDHIPGQVTLINALLDRGHAYVAADGSVYFRLASFPGYGRLSRLADREVQSGASGVASAVAADEYDKEGAADFALWKAWKPDDGDIRWPGPRGAAPGRPGWHIECSAMGCHYLGPAFDLHAGGEDLLFPHHENEIAQSECGYGHAPFARHWFHTAHLMVEGRKMSKSLGNLYTLDDLRTRGASPIAVRYLLLSGHYRQKLNFTFDGLRAADSALQRLARVEGLLRERAGSATPLQAKGPPPEAWAGPWLRLADDLDTPGALGALFARLNSVDPSRLTQAGAAEDLAGLRSVLDLLGLPFTAAAPAAEVPPAVAALAERRWAAKAARDFATADALRSEITALGWTMLDGRDAYRLEPIRG